MRIRKAVGFFLMLAVCWVIVSVTGASPANFYLIRDFSRTCDVSLIPFSDLGDILREGSTMGQIVNIAGNIVLFCPLGFVLPLVWTGFRRLGRTVAFGAAASLWIELNQLFTFRATSVDDLLLNTLGTALGYACAAAVLRIGAGWFPPDRRERHVYLPAAAAFLLPYAFATGLEFWFYVTQW